MMMIENMSNEDYHNRPEISNTQLSLFSADQYGIDWAKNCPTDKEKLRTFDFGDAIHSICLEPDRLKSEFVIMPELNLRTNAGKEEKAAFLIENEGKKILTADDHKKLTLMFESVMAHPQARTLIEAHGLAESSWFWTDKDTGVKCRCRPDKIIVNKAVDIKSTPELVKFKYSVADYRYFVQNAFYVDGLAANGIIDPFMEFLAIQKTISIGRYPVMVCRLPDDVVDYGRMVYKQELEAYARYLDGHREPTRELEMSPRFYVDLDEAMGEVQI